MSEPPPVEPSRSATFAQGLLAILVLLGLGVCGACQLLSPVDFVAAPALARI